MTERVSPARIAALAVLESLHEANDIPLPVLLDAQCRRLRLDARDAALTTELVYGVLRSEKRLSALLRPFLRKPDSLPLALRLLLLMAAYELTALDQIPQRATLHQCVDLAKKRFGSSMGGLTNAVLRAFTRADLEVELGKDSTVRTLALTGSLPDWLAELWLEQYGDEAITFARNAAEKPLSAWRLNARLPIGQQDELKAELSDLGEASSNCGIFLFSAIAFTVREDLAQRLADLERAGLLSRQGAASQKVAERVAALVYNHVTPGDLSFQALPMVSPRQALLWDACCGRGGKTCALLERGVHVALASDPSAPRLEALRSSLDRLGLPVPEIRCAELSITAAEVRAGKRAPFPFILLDAPCSGTGTLARNPELRLRLTPTRLDEAVRLQSTLLDDAWTALEPGGLLFYATCALNKAENEAQISTFIARTTDSLLVEQHLYPPPEHSPGQDVLFFAVLGRMINRG